MASESRRADQHNAFKLDLTQAHLVAAIAFAKLARQCCDETESSDTDRKTGEAYQEALHLLEHRRLDAPRMGVDRDEDDT
jgi:hypothetical protein